MQLFYSDIFVLPLPDGHRFPMRKYELLYQRVAQSELAQAEMIQMPPAASAVEITRAHDAGYLRRVMQGELSDRELRRIGFPWSPALVQRSLQTVGGTIAACRAALAEGRAVNLAGGTHHAFADHGQGFCVFNDAVVAARTVQAEGLANRVLVIDLDVHQGNGTAAMTRDDPSIFSFSIHGAKNFPFHKEQSDLDIALEDGVGDDAYLEALRWGLAQLPWAGSDLAIYLAGADPFSGDRLGRLALSKAGLAQRDRVVFEACAAAGVPVAVAMAGGYAHNVEDIVDIHFETVRAASRLGRRPARA